jgi:hypothetical protein
MSESVENGLFWSYQERADNVKKVKYFADEFTSSWRANTKEREDAKLAFNMYLGNQWNEKAAADLTARGLPVNTFNHIMPKIDKIAGQLILNPNQLNYTSINQSTVDGTNAMDSLYQYDNERGNWAKAKNRWIKDILIHTGVAEMFVDYTHSKLGNISIRALNRVTDVEWDGYWNGDKINDCRVIFKPVWLTARQIKDQFQTKSEDIETSIAQYEQLDGMSDTPESKLELADRNGDFYDSTTSRYRVIECIYMQTTPRTRQYSDKLNRWLKENENPDTMRDNGDLISEFNDSVDICKIITIAPGIDNGIVLNEGEHPVQVGRLPFYIKSADNTMGTRQGKVKGMQDAQITFNKRTSMQTSHQLTANNGAILYREDLFADKATEADFKANSTVPGKKFPVDANANLRDGIAPVPKTNMPEGLQQSIEAAAEFMDISVNETDASAGRSGGANESSVLFVNKRNQSQVAHVTVAEEVAQGEKDMAEDYFYLSKVVYKGVNRQFTNAKTREKFEVNKRINLEDFNPDDVPVNATVNHYLSSGYVIQNEIETLPRHDVIIKRSELGLDQREKSLSVFSEMSQRTINPILKSQFEKAMIPLLELPSGNVPAMMNASDIFVEFQVAQIESQMIAMQLQTEQSKMQLAQMQQQMAQPPQEGGQQQIAPPGDSRTAANGAGQGNLGDGIAQDTTNVNNSAKSDG